MIDFLFLPHRDNSGSRQKFFHINLLPLAGSSFSSLKVFHDCSGGNSRPSRPSGVGGGNFLMAKSDDE
jgi:hypothetical protein